MWYVGQQIVAIKNHPQGKFRTGDTFTIQSISESKCICSFLNFDIGVIRTKDDFMKCVYCANKWMDKSNIWWFNESNFTPLQSIPDIEEAIEKLKEELPAILSPLHHCDSPEPVSSSSQVSPEFFVCLPNSCDIIHRPASRLLSLCCLHQIHVPG